MKKTKQKTPAPPPKTAPAPVEKPRRVPAFYAGALDCAGRFFERIPGWTWLLLFAAIWLGLRVPWLASDGGVPSFWEYGYYVTDEGYHLYGGKEKYLYGRFVDVARNEALTYGYIPLMHFFSYLAHLVFGLSNWVWRVPFFLVNFGAWLAVFRWCAVRGGAAVAFLLCVAVSCSPIFIVYERTACNDTLIGSLLVLSFCAACSCRVVWLAVSAFVFALIAGVKPSFYVLLPVVLAGVLSQRKTKWQWLDAVVFCVLAVAGVLCVKAGARLLVAPDALAQGVTATELIRKTTTHYPLPNILDFASHFKGFASFPRHPGGVFFGPLALFVLPFPLALLVARLSDFKRRPYLDWRVLLYAAIPVYVAAVAVVNGNYTHYYTPALAMIPFLFITAREDCTLVSPGANRRGGMLCALVLCVAAFLVVRYMPYDANPAKTFPFFSQQYNLPQELPWLFNWKSGVCFAVLGTAAACFLGWNGRAWQWRCAAVFVSLLAFASVVWSQAPGAVLAPHMKLNAAEFILNMALCATAGLALVFAVFVFPQRVWMLKITPLAMVCLFYVASPKWRTAAGEILKKGTDYQARAAAELAPLLPDGAVVLGERTNQALMSLRVKTATTFASNCNPIPVIQRVLEQDSGAQLFALIDPQHSYCMQYYEQNKHWVALVPLKQVELPSFGDGRPVPVTLCRIVVKP